MRAPRFIYPDPDDYNSESEYWAAYEDSVNRWEDECDWEVDRRREEELWND